MRGNRFSKNTVIFLCCLFVFLYSLVYIFGYSDPVPQEPEMNPEEKCRTIPYSVSVISTHDKCDFHAGEFDLWLVINGLVYNVTDWIQRHPGGGAICQGAKVDSTYYFNLFHGAETGRTYLPRYCIGYLGKGQEMPKPKNVDDNGDEVIQ